MDNLIGKQYVEAFKQEFTGLFLGNQDAVSLAMDILYVVHVWDDLIDKDPSTDEQINTAFRKLIYDIPLNPIMTKELSVLWLSCYNQWLAANELEAEGKVGGVNKAYMLRASIYQLFHHIAIIVGGFKHGTEVAKRVYDLYGETLEGLQEELRNA